MMVSKPLAVSAFSLHVVSQSFHSTVDDVPPPRTRTVRVDAGGTHFYPVTDLRKWLYVDRLGTYDVNISYDRVDSNPVRLVIVK